MQKIHESTAFSKATASPSMGLRVVREIFSHPKSSACPIREISPSRRIGRPEIMIGDPTDRCKCTVANPKSGKEKSSKSRNDSAIGTESKKRNVANHRWADFRRAYDLVGQCHHGYKIMRCSATICYGRSKTGNQIGNPELRP